jgi:endonuclease/exonuclease/phosphatase family metal-dependent hydrolase
LIVTGDFNSGEGSQPYVELMQRPADGQAQALHDAFRTVHPQRGANEGTFNGFQPGRGGARIDWILTSPDWQPMAAEIITAERDGRYPSDHFPVLADLTLQGRE